MEAVEIIVYLSVAVVIGGMIIAFLVGMDGGSIYGAISNIFNREPEVSFRSVDEIEFAPVVFNLWKSCNYGLVNETLVVSLKANNEITNETLFDSFKKHNLCYTIQSGGNDCGDREDVYLPENIDGPALVEIFCDERTNTINITSIT